MTGWRKAKQTKKKKKSPEILIMCIMLIVVFLITIITVVEATSTRLSSFSNSTRKVIYILSKVMKFYHLIFSTINFISFIKFPCIPQGCWNTEKCKRENNNSLYILFKNRNSDENLQHKPRYVLRFHIHSWIWLFFNPKYHMKIYPGSLKNQYPVLHLCKM